MKKKPKKLLFLVLSNKAVFALEKSSPGAVFAPARTCEILADAPASTADLIPWLEKHFPAAKIVQVTSKQGQRCRKKLENLSSEEASAACRALLMFPNQFPEPMVPASLLLLFLLARVVDCVLPALPGVPLVQLDGLAELPPPLTQLAALFCIPEKLKGKNWSLMRTSCLDAIVPLGAAEPESNPAAYLGGWVRDWRGKKKRFWLPPWNQTVLFNRNIPSSLCTSLIRLSPLAVFVSVNPFTSREKEGRLLLRLDGQKLLAYDVQQLALLADKIEAIQFQISSFVQWFNHSKKRIHAWPRVLEEFRPRTIHGRFTSWQSSPETSLYVSELAILKCFLYFLAKKQGLLTADEVNSILGMYWKLMLPKSVPSGSSESTPLSWDSPATFWRFLNEYISESARSISTEGAPVSGGIVGAFHRLASGESFLIFPRVLLLQAYMGWLSAKGGRTLEQAGRWEAQMQTAIQGWGVPLKREGEDISWRFTFYQSHQAPQGLKEKLPCLAFPLDQLPQEIIRSLESSLGAACSRWLPSVGQPEGGDAA